jgi:hypothetical protein
VREDRIDLREGRKEQLVMDDGGVDSRGYRARLQSERIWEERSGYGDDDSRERTTVDDKGEVRSCGIVQYHQILPNIAKYYQPKSWFPRVLFSERGFCVAAGDIW